MLNNTGFDQWADEYDRSVARSDAAGSYPFAGYQEILDAIVDRVTAHGGGAVLDIGFGTGTLTARLYAQGCRMYGQDFSERMVQPAISNKDWWSRSARSAMILSSRPIRCTT